MHKDKSSFKVLHVLDHSLPVHSGYAFRSQSLLLAQKRRGWNPLAVTSPKHYTSCDDPWTEFEQIGALGYHRTRKVSNSSIPLAGELSLMTSLGRSIASIAKRESPDLLHAHSPILNAIPALWISRRLGIPMVYEMRALWEDAAVDHGTYGQHSWKYKTVKSLETWICHKAAQVTTISNGLRTDLIERGIASEKITVIPNGVDLDNFRPCGPGHGGLENWNLKGKKIIGFIGSFFRYEGLDLLIEALAHLSKTRSDVGLLLVGGGEVEAELKAQISRLHLEKLVCLPGPIPPHQIPGVYVLIDILVYPRHSMRLTELVTPLKPLEAMAMRKPVVASNVGGHRELIKHDETGLLFPAGDVSALTGCLLRMLDYARLRERLGQQGFEWVRSERLWEMTTSGYADVYAAAQSKQHTTCR